jgi:glycosyltransferase involved in cell wall biosynthesis
MKPLVDICVPAYNSGVTIERTLKSLVDQTYKNITIHVVDNVSTDNTVDVAKTIGDDRIIIHTNKTHYSIGEYNWNRCFDYMNGEYASIFHADDIYPSKMIKKQVDILETHKNVGAVFAWGNIIDHDDNIIATPKNAEPYTHNKELTFNEVILSTLNYGNQLMAPTPLYRSNLYKSLAPFRHEAFGYSSDLDMWLRTAKEYNLFVINEPVFGHRTGSATTRPLHTLRTSEEMHFRVMDYHLKGIVGLPQSALDKYEMRRMEDKLTCIKNSIIKMGARTPSNLMWALRTKMDKVL